MPTGQIEIKLFSQRCLCYINKGFPLKPYLQRYFYVTNWYYKRIPTPTEVSLPAGKPEVLFHQSVFAREIAFTVDKLNALSTLMSVSICYSWSHTTTPAVLSIKLFMLQDTRTRKGRNWKDL